MEENINRLLRILNRHSIKDVNRLYRDKEVGLEIESFTKHPDVRWSDDLKRRMIKAAKHKRISPGRIKYIEEQIRELNTYAQEEHIKKAAEDVYNMIENLQNLGVSNSEILLLRIEFSELKHLAYVQAYGKSNDKWYDNELGGFESLFSSAKYWDELDSRKFYSMAEQLEIIEIEDEEFPQIFVQLRELRVFQAIKKAMELPMIKEQLNLIIPNGKIEIGVHDDKFYIIRENEYAT